MRAEADKTGIAAPVHHQSRHRVALGNWNNRMVARLVQLQQVIGSEINSIQ